MNDIIALVSEWLKPANVNINPIIQNNNEGYEVLELEITGDPVKEIAEKFGIGGKLILRWILPELDGDLCTLRDFQTGDKYISSRIYRRPEFGEKGVSPLHLCPDLEKGKIYSAWLSDVEFKWKRFARNACEKCTLDNFIRLESGLNAIFTSSSARQKAKFTREDESINPLLAIENRRQVLIDWHAETLGRLRIPHISHKKKLCPFQTPESKLTGLLLNLTADENYLFSIAVGMIPYPNHTDGPRLMMGGKNLKQAETGIASPEAPIVPGFYEGERSRDIPVLRQYMRSKRFFPYLGVNALTVIMPFDGYTYEDGLVISQTLAKKFCIHEGNYRQQKIFDVVVYQPEIENLFSDCEGKRFIYGDELPAPNVNFYDKDNPEKLICWNEKYNHHAPGVLESVKVKCSVKKILNKKVQGSRVYNFEIAVIWNFIVERPLDLGDKLTGRNGNKGVVTKILPDELMPQVHFHDEVLPAELIISPCSIIGRKNLGQIWEMIHSLLIIKGNPELDIKHVQIDGINEIAGNLRELLRETGCDDFGTFRITLNDREDVRAFAGWQYFCRLHHHAWKKLQARGKNAPYDFMTGQPSRFGTLTGQRMGEMENWAFLSHGASSVLSLMRVNQTGNFEKTRSLFRKILRSLGIVLIEHDKLTGNNNEDEFYENGLLFRSRNNNDDTELERKNLRWALVQEYQGAFCAVINDKSCRKIAETLRDNLGDNPIVKKLNELIDGEEFFNTDGSIHVEPEILSYSAEFSSGLQEAGTINFTRKPPLRDLLLKFSMFGSDYSRAEALIAYRDGLIDLLSHKSGIPRYYLSGRRYNHSGRAVIVPEPSLKVEQVYLPASMLIELLDDYDKDYVYVLPEEFRDLQVMRKIFNDFTQRKNEALKLAEKLDDFLCSEIGEIWCWLIRQPSLHRHNVMAFRVRCWAFPVIGIAPFVTPGFNADFDGDTMAVFLPPYEAAKDLSCFSILNNPGLIGNGASAFANSLDIALGWWKLAEEKEKFSEYLARLLISFSSQDLRGEIRISSSHVSKTDDDKISTENQNSQNEIESFSITAHKISASPQNVQNEITSYNLTAQEREKLSTTLQNLQSKVMRASTGAATLSPIELENLAQDISDLERAPNISAIINSGAKGTWKDIQQIVKSIGEVEVMTDDDGEETAKKFITGNFWRGLSDDELFTYSYPSRLSMAQKKLSVAEAGYLSRQLAEKLFDFTVNIHDCGTEQGIEIEYSPEDLCLNVDGEVFPVNEITRVLWGRVKLGEDKCMSSREINAFMKIGGKIILRSPLTCRERKSGHVCALCYGADVASMPFDKPVPVYEKFAAGLTAALAIGERGTQLAMKRFHDVSGKSQSQIQTLRKYLLGRKIYSLAEIIKSLLRNNNELPQSLIHFETACACGNLKADGKFLSEFTGERLSQLLIHKGDFIFTDDLMSMKSILLWE